MDALDPAPEPGSLEWKMAAAILFMPEIGHLTAGVTREIIRRCARVAVEFYAESVTCEYDYVPHPLEVCQSDHP